MSETQPPETDDEQADDTEDDGPEYRRSRSMPQLDTSGSLSDMTNRDLRGKIAQRAAHRPPKNALTKEILNSVHAWFTGSFFVKPVYLNQRNDDGSVVHTKADVLEAVLDAAIASYENHPTNPDDEDRPDHPVPALLDFRDEVAALDDNEQPRSMNKDELRQFVNAMDTSGDNRSWSIRNQD